MIHRILSSIFLQCVVKIYLTVTLWCDNIKFKGGRNLNFLDKLDILMKEQNLNKHTLSHVCGIPYTTIDAFYKKGYENIKLSTIKKLAQYFNTTIDYLMREEVEDRCYGKENPYNSQYNEKAQEVLALYLQLDIEDRAEIRGEMKHMLKSEKYSIQEELKNA